MHKKYAFLFPGQGSQYVGMGKDFFEHFSSFRSTIQQAEDILSLDLSSLMFKGPEDELMLTKNSQLAIYVLSVGILTVLNEQFPALTPAVCAGLSLGEYTALTASGKISFTEALPLVFARSHYMHDCCLNVPGSMLVILGMTEESIKAVLESHNLREVWIANLNCPGQVVIAGTENGLASASLILKENGAKRVLSLDVSGAFHSPLMQQAQNKLGAHIDEIKIHESSIDLVMNVPGDYVKEVSLIRSFMHRQVTECVRWEKGIRSIVNKGPHTYIEIGCGKTLSGMNKRIGVTDQTISLETVKDLECLAHL